MASRAKSPLRPHVDYSSRSAGELVLQLAATEPQVGGLEWQLLDDKETFRKLRTELALYKSRTERLTKQLLLQQEEIARLFESREESVVAEHQLPSDDGVGMVDIDQMLSEASSFAFNEGQRQAKHAAALRLLARVLRGRLSVLAAVTVSVWRQQAADEQFRLLNVSKVQLSDKLAEECKARERLQAQVICDREVASQLVAHRDRLSEALTATEEQLNTRTGEVLVERELVSEQSEQLVDQMGCVQEQDYEIEKLKELNQQLQDGSFQQDAEIEELKKQILQLTAEKKKLDRGVMLLEESITQHALIAAEKEELATELTAKDAELSGTAEALAEVTAERDRLLEELTTKDAELINWPLLADGANKAEQALVEMTAERDGLLKKLAEKDATCTSKEQALADMTAERDALLKKAREKLAEKDTTCAEMTAERDALLQKLAAKDATCTSKEQALADMTAERDGLLKKLAEKDATCTSKEQALADMTAERDALLKKLAAKDAELSSLAKECGDCESNKVLAEQASVDNTVLVKTVKTLNLELQQLERELGLLRAQSSEAEVQLSEAKQTIVDLKQYTGPLERQLSESVSDLEALNELQSRTAEELERVREQLQLCFECKARLEEKLAVETNGRVGAEESLAAAEAELQRLRELNGPEAQDAWKQQALSAEKRAGLSQLRGLQMTFLIRAHNRLHSGCEPVDAGCAMLNRWRVKQMAEGQVMNLKRAAIVRQLHMAAEYRASIRSGTAIHNWTTQREIDECRQQTAAAVKARQLSQKRGVQLTMLCRVSHRVTAWLDFASATPQWPLEHCWLSSIQRLCISDWKASSGIESDTSSGIESDTSLELIVTV